MVMAQNLHTQTKRKRDCEHQFTEANRPRMFLDVRFGLSVMVVSPGLRNDYSPSDCARQSHSLSLTNASPGFSDTLPRLPRAAIFLPGARILYLPLARR
jgi:hypothetical protein